MSTLNSPEALVRSLVLENQRPSDLLLKETGLDRELFDAVWSIIRPGIDRFRGYKPLEGWCRSAKERQEVAKSGLSGPRHQTLLALTVGVGPKGNPWHLVHIKDADSWCTSLGEHDVAMTRVMLTRRSGWIVWNNSPSSTFQVVDNPEDLEHAVHSVLQEGTEHRFGYDRPLDSLWVDLSKGLHRIFEDSMREKHELILQEDKSLEAVTATLGSLPPVVSPFHGVEPPRRILVKRSFGSGLSLCIGKISTTVIV